MTFPALSCEDVHLDAMDVAGDNQLDMNDNFVKFRLDSKGKPLGDAEVEKPNEGEPVSQDKEEDPSAVPPHLRPGYCGDCYGAGENEGSCCNSCDSLLSAYGKKGWNTRDVLNDSEQCVREKRGQKKLIQGQGCRLEGTMDVNKVAGNFHVAMGESMVKDGRHIHQFLPEDAPNYNCTHVIHELSFDGGEEGDHIGGPLDGRMRVVTEEVGTGLYQYFVKVVPYSVKERNGSERRGAKYSHTERFRPLMIDVPNDAVMWGYFNSGGKRGVPTGGELKHSSKEEHHKVQTSLLPGVFWVYELNPFEIREDKTDVRTEGTVRYMAVRIMAIVGGVFTIAGWVSRIDDERGRGKWGMGGGRGMGGGNGIISLKGNE